MASWKDSLDSANRKSFYHDYEYFKSYVDNLEQEPGSLEIITARTESRLFSIIPIRRMMRWFGGITFRGLELPSHNHLALCDIPVLNNGCGIDILKIVKDYVSDKYAGKWDFICLPRVIEDSNVMEAFAKTSLGRKHIFQTGSCHYIDCSRDYQHAVAGISTHFRHELRRKLRKAARIGCVHFHFERNKSGLLEAYNRFLKLESSGWKGTNGAATAINLNRELVNFYDQILTEYGEQGKCLISLMSIDGKDVAGQFCTINDETVFIQKIAYNEEFKRISPGSLLLDALIEWCCNDKQLKYINLVTASSWSHRWAPKTLNVYTIYLFNSTFPWLWILLVEKIKGLFRKYSSRNGKERQGLNTTVAGN